MPTGVDAALRFMLAGNHSRAKHLPTLENFATFKERIATLGLGDLALLEPMFYWDVTFWDHCIWPSDEMEKIERKIRQTRA